MHATTRSGQPAAASTAPPVQRWERATEWPLAAAVLFLLAYAWPILHPGIPSGWRHFCTTVTLAIWAAFGVDYVIRLGITGHRWRYFWRHLPDLAVVTLPILRPLRLLRLVMLIRALNRRAASSLYGRITIYVRNATALLLLCASLAILDSERGRHDANIHNFADALWWSATTMTTVGYGDRYPVTGQGRLVATGLMIGGIALLGTVTAIIASGLSLKSLDGWLSRGSGRWSLSRRVGARGRRSSFR